MTKKTYSEKLKDPRWQKMRLDVMQRDNFTCRLCGDKETTLNIHHAKYINGNPWDIDSKHLITLCEDCHTEVNNLKKISGIETYWYDFDNDYFKIVKCNEWVDGGRVMFISFIDNKFIHIYDKDGNFENGLTFTASDSDKLEEIAKLLTFKIKQP